MSENQINIVNYNKPLPPLKLQDLNERTFFNERDTENPEIRDMFKALGIIESFGTGTGEAKRALENNGSPGVRFSWTTEIVPTCQTGIPLFTDIT